MLKRAAVLAAAAVAAAVAAPAAPAMGRGADHVPGIYPDVIPSRAGGASMTLDVHGRALPPEAPQVNIVGLTRPTSVAYDAQGYVYIAEKSGVIKVMNGWQGTPTQVLIDLTGRVASYGDHGLTSITFLAVNGQGYLWLTYMLQNPDFGNVCNDYGQMDGRPLNQVNGCLVSGVFSRIPITNGEVSGPEEIVINGYEGTPMQYCCQFTTHSMTSSVVHPDGHIYVAMGDGAAFTIPDSGQLGANVCNDNGVYRGAYRSQDPNRLNGKMLRLDPVTLEYEVVATGLRNPFRVSVYGNNVIFSETGWYSGEELNMLPVYQPGVVTNFG